MSESNLLRFASNRALTWCEAERRRLLRIVAPLGCNSTTSAHPEVIVADNFVLRVSGARNMPAPWVAAAVDRVLGESCQLYPAVPSMRRTRVGATPPRDCGAR